MNRSIKTILLGLVLICLGSCSSPPESDKAAALGEEFSLALGGKIEI